jgi:hypothetical protein
LEIDGKNWEAVEGDFGQAQ